MHERDLIQSIALAAARKHPLLETGIGDDCAVFSSQPNSQWVVTTDMLVENVHFDTRWHSPYLLGRKSLAVNISDIAAMGGVPQFALISIGLCSSYDAEWIDQYMKGCLSQLDEHSCVLIGGDTVSADQLSLSITILGTVDSKKAILRGGAGPGDTIYVSGPLGSAAAALELCRMRSYSVAETLSCTYQQSLRCHLDPSARVGLGQRLAATGCITAMQDISDGIATDLSHICRASNVAATVYEDALPAHPELESICQKIHKEPVDLQLRGGEDYELVFTVAEGCEDEVKERLAPANGIFAIGKISEGSGVSMMNRAGERMHIDFQGYEHRS